jgi:hypothetical protein
MNKPDITGIRRIIMKPNLEEYLKDNFIKGFIDHSIRVSHIDEQGNPHFYIHPTGHDGDTLDFVVDRNEIIQKHVGEVKGITINGSRMVTTRDEITYHQVLDMMGIKPGPGFYTMIYSVKNGRKGHLGIGDKTYVTDNMVFNVDRTTNA